MLTLVAGTVDPGGAGTADGTGSAARFYGIALTVAADGNAYVADGPNGTVRRITPSGVVTTPWGQVWQRGSIDGTGTAARFQFPYRVIAVPDGSLYVLDSSGTPDFPDQLRRIDRDGVVSTVLSLPSRDDAIDPHRLMAIDAQSRLYFVDRITCALRRLDPAKGTTETLAPLQPPDSCSSSTPVHLDADGNVYFVDASAVLKKRSATGVVSTVATSPTGRASPVAVRSDGSVIFHGGDNVIYIVPPGGEARKLTGAVQPLNDRDSVDGDADTARFQEVRSMVADAANNVMVLDGTSVVRRLEADGRVVTVAGRAPQDRFYRPGTGAQARILDEPDMVADAAGNAYFTASAFDLRAIARITPEGVVSTIAGRNDERGTQDGAGAGARFEVIHAMGRDPAGALLVADWRESANCGRYGPGTKRSVVRRVSAAGEVRTLPYSFDGRIERLAALSGTTMLVTGQRLDGCNLERKTVEAVESGAETRVPTLPNGPVTGDGRGDTWHIDGNAVFRRSADGRMALVAGSVAESGDRDAAGAAARFNGPRGLDVDALGNVYVADTGNGTVRKITPDGMVTTFVGRAGQHGIVLGALPGGLDHPSAVAVVPQGLLIRSRLALLRVSL